MPGNFSNVITKQWTVVDYWLQRFKSYNLLTCQTYGVLSARVRWLTLITWICWKVRPTIYKFAYSAVALDHNLFYRWPTFLAYDIANCNLQWSIKLQPHSGALRAQWPRQIRRQKWPCHWPWQCIRERACRPYVLECIATSLFYDRGIARAVHPGVVVSLRNVFYQRSVHMYVWTAYSEREITKCRSALVDCGCGCHSLTLLTPW